MSQDQINKQAFIEEAQDLLAELETALLELEDSPEDKELVDRVFRAMHTIKGSGAMFGFEDIAAFTHEVETMFDLIRNGEMPVTKEVLDVTLLSRDNIARLVEASQKGEEADAGKTSDLVARLRAITTGEAPPQAKPPVPGAAATAVDDDEDAGGFVTYRVRFKPNREILFSGSRPLGLVEELAELGNAMCFAHPESIPPLEEMEPEHCYLWWDVILGTNRGEDAIRDVFMFVEDECDILIQPVDMDSPFDMDDEPSAYKRLGEILVERGDIAAEELQSILEQQKRLGTILSESGKVPAPVVESALAEQKAVQELRKVRTEKKTEETKGASSIRVAADKLDYLVDLVGELVIVQAQISQVVSEARNPVLTALSEQLERLSDELRDSTLGVRMLPIGTTFSKFRRLVRDLSSELGKEIELHTTGAETELDKTVIERLNDPLVHLLRNSIDHGVEPPDERIAQGKPRAGTIHLTAEHSGGEVLISITDDGAGLDAEAIRAKGIERGLITPDVELSRKDTFALILQAGFSTAKKLTSVSGRGVGMDVVKRSIEALRGAIVIDSEHGKGTTITVKLPLTLAIIDGLQVKVGDEYFVVPLSLVEECVELLHDENERETGRRIVNLRGEIVPYLRLRDQFEVPGKQPDIEQIVVVGVGESRVGIVVDFVIGEHQTVIKTLGRVYRDVEGISGATIKGDGTMALILDVPKLVQLSASDAVAPV